MTNREPDDLYDALRNRLADYGQEPPAPLWANIRAQLPPPVAAPQRRARRWALAALALLLLAGLGTWQWWPPAGRPTPQTATTLPRPAASRPAAAPGRIAPAPANTMQRASTDGLAPAKTRPLAAAAAAAATAGAPAATSKAAATPENPDGAAGLLAAASGANRLTAAATGVAPNAALPGAPAAATAAAAHQQAATARLQTRSGAGQAARQHGVATRASRVSATLASTVARPAAPENSLTAAQLPAATRTAAIRAENNADAAIRPAVGAGGEQQLASIPAETRHQTTRELPLPAATPTQPGRSALARIVALGLPLQAPAPAVLAWADTLPPLPAAAVRRWAVQALAGPGLTSRTMSSQRLYAAASPVFSNNPTRNTSGSAEDERAATGFGAEAQLQRQLTGRWSLGAGLGYHTFATSQSVTVRVVYGPSPASNFIADSVSTVPVRNAYHFLNLPLRVGYQLGAGSARLRYGLRAGADVALYLGGRSTDDGIPGSLGRSWGSSGSPYRPLSLALSLGAEVRYQLAPGWELLAQPTLTHFVTSVARPAAGYAPRYPVAATALVGVAYWLR